MKKAEGDSLKEMRNLAGEKEEALMVTGFRGRTDGDAGFTQTIWSTAFLCVVYL